MKKLLFSLALFLLLTGCTTPYVKESSLPDSQQTNQDSDENTASEPFTFTTQTFDGEEIDQSIFSNARLNVVNVWATFCNPCIKEMPELAKLNEEGGEDFQIIGLCADLDPNSDDTDETFQLAQEIIEQTGANYIHMRPSESLLPVLTASSVVPVTFFFDDQGNVVGDGISGSYDYDTWKDIITERLEQLDAQTDTEANQNAG